VRVRIWCALAAALAGTVAVTSVVRADADRDPGPGLAIKVLSNRADLLSGGDAYVQIAGPGDTAPGNVRVELDGRDISGVFAKRSDGRVLGVITGMGDGAHTLTAHADGLSGARISLDNHPIGGPVFSGPQVLPWFCTTRLHGMQQATDAQCNAPARYEWYYLPSDSTTAKLQPYDPAHPASNVQMITNDRGVRVPFIVRDERGTADRGIYDIAVLYDPTKPWTPWDPQPGWNGKAFFRAGGSCDTGHVQGDYQSAALQETSLVRGFAVLTSGMTVLGFNCNDVVAAEALMMVKEHFIETYGQIRYTMGEGCSGGSTLIYSIAANYPGLLDGLLPSCAFPDMWEFTQSAQDCALLTRAFQARPAMWQDDLAQTAVTGFQTDHTCSAWQSPWQALFQPGYTPGCVASRMPGPHPAADFVYDPQRNPNGTRCTLQDYTANELGLRPDGKANRPYDNVGVQYGLQALTDKKISVEQFLDLNNRIGGWDIDGQWQPQRSVADADALGRAYRSGRVLNTATLAGVPIVAIRYWDEHGYHTSVEDRVIRERLIHDTGSAANEVVITVKPGTTAKLSPFDMLDEWLGAIEADHSGAGPAQKANTDRPAGVANTCVINGPITTDAAACARAFPHYSKPRLQAGGPITEDVLKCQLRPLFRADYPVDMTTAQFARLLDIFPNGVCDWSLPGQGAAAPSGPWQTFANGPDGRPLDRPPASTPIDP
jgi:Tannase-like family of unknown function (DUF6351)